jgi:hypothetical protein
MKRRSFMEPKALSHGRPRPACVGMEEPVPNLIPVAIRVEKFREQEEKE